MPPTTSDVHLSYCTNIHPGESWSEVRANLERYLVPVRERVAPGRPFGVGLRLSGEAARALAAPQVLDELRAFLAARAIGASVYYPRPLHLQPCFRELGYRVGDLPIAEQAAREVLALPIHPGLAPAQVDAVVEALAAFYGRGRG